MAAISGQTTVTTAGTAVQLSATEFRINGPLIVKGLDGNTGATYVGNDGAGDVTASNGYELGAGDAVVFDYVGDLQDIWVDSATDGDIVCWIAAQVM